MSINSINPNIMLGLFELSTIHKAYKMIINSLDLLIWKQAVKESSVTELDAATSGMTDRVRRIGGTRGYGRVGYPNRQMGSLSSGTR